MGRHPHGLETRLALLLVTVASAWGCGESPHEGVAALLPPRPGSHVIVVSFDALRPDALGVYGYDRETSPNLDAFAREAVVFENAYSAAPKTPTSFAAAFTGRHPTDAFRNWRLVEHPTLAELFRDAGYRTAAFANNPQLVAERGFGRGFETYRVDPAHDDVRLVRDAMAWLAEARGDPLFLWLHLIDPHAPWVAREGSTHLYRDDYRGPYGERAARLLVLEDPVELRRVRSLYDGEIHAADALFGELIDALRRLAIWDDAIVIFTSDHGEEFMEHGHLQHGRLTEENVRIPMIVRHPAHDAPSRTGLRVSNLDLLPTLARLAGLEAPPELDGRSWLSADPKARAHLAVANTDPWILAASIVVDEKKLIVHCGDRRDRDLYDLASDPGEQHDLAQTRPELAARLEARLLEELGVARCADIAVEREGSGPGRTRGLTPFQIEVLKKLGYLDPRAGTRDARAKGGAEAGRSPAGRSGESR